MISTSDHTQRSRDYKLNIKGEVTKFLEDNGGAYLHKWKNS